MAQVCLGEGLAISRAELSAPDGVTRAPGLSQASAASDEPSPSWVSAPRAREVSRQPGLPEAERFKGRAEIRDTEANKGTFPHLGK